MDIDTTELIQMLSNGEHGKFVAAVHDELSARAGVATAELKKNVAHGIFSSDDEDVEEVEVADDEEEEVADDNDDQETEEEDENT